MTTAIILTIALCGSLAGNFLLWRLYRSEAKRAALEARNAVAMAVNELNTQIKDAASEQARIDHTAAGGASDVLGRLRKAGH